MTESIEDSCDQLTRYGGKPDRRIAEIVSALASLNDDIWHVRNPDLVRTQIAEIKAMLDEIAASPALT